MVPESSVDAVIASPLGATTIEVGAVAVCTGLPESVTVTEKFEVAIVVGVPEIAPVEAEIERPLGNWPDEIDQMYGAVPPVALNELLYASVAVAPGSVAEPIASLGAAIVNVKVAAVACCGEPLSVTDTPSVNVPLAVGV